MLICVYHFGYVVVGATMFWCSLVALVMLKILCLNCESSILSQAMGCFQFSIWVFRNNAYRLNLGSWWNEWTCGGVCPQ
jgi:hypothetical protein